MDEELPRPGWLPPDDRLWRHPSEVRTNPAPVPTLVPPPRLRGWLKRSWALTVPIALLSGLVGAAACAGLLYAAGALGSSPAYKVVTAPPPVYQRSASTTGLSVPQAVEPWVVGLSVDGNQGVENGSGVVVTANGQGSYVVTDSELFAEAGSDAQVTVTTYAGATETAGTVQLDPAAGIAVVKVAWSPAITPELGTVAEVETGQQVYAVGSESMSAAMAGSYFASGSITDQATYLQPVNGGSVAMFPMLVADLEVDPSAYGGALVDSSGNLIGITNPMSTQLQKPDITYVTPIDTVMADVSQLIRYGHLSPHAWMGVLQATDISGPGATAMGVTSAVQVDALASGSPLAKAGLRAGDIITAINGSSVPSVGTLLSSMADFKPGQVAVVNWLHQGHAHRGDVTMGAQPATVGSS